jgi:hypothetical protein
MDPLVPLTVTV